MSAKSNLPESWIIRLKNWGYHHIADGINASDLNEYRPGLQASEEAGLLHPFLSLGIEKEEIRQMAQECGFNFWNKPSASCLASRIPYGEEITVEKLQMVEKAENILHDLGFSNLRVRLHGKIARIELSCRNRESRKLTTSNYGAITGLRFCLYYP